MDVTEGVLGSCQVTVIASLSSCATATTLEGHEGTPTSEDVMNQDCIQRRVRAPVCVCVRACVRACVCALLCVCVCVRACVRVCVWGGFVCVHRTLCVFKYTCVTCGCGGVVCVHRTLCVFKYMCVMCV